MHCWCRPYVTTTPPNCSILKPQKQRCLKPLQLLSLAAAAQTRSRGLSKECTFDFWRREKIAEPPLRLRPGLKNARVLKNRCRQAEAHQARGLLIVLTNLMEASVATLGFVSLQEMDLFGRGSIFLSSIWIIDRWQRGGGQSKEPQQLDGSEEFLRKKLGSSGI